MHTCSSCQSHLGHTLFCNYVPMYNRCQEQTWGNPGVWYHRPNVKYSRISLFLSHLPWCDVTRTFHYIISVHGRILIKLDRHIIIAHAVKKSLGGDVTCWSIFRWVTESYWCLLQLWEMHYYVLWIFSTLIFVVPCKGYSFPCMCIIALLFDRYSAQTGRINFLCSEYCNHPKQCWKFAFPWV